MAGSRQSKRVSWPSDENLCKVRLFLSEDAPYQSGHDAQDHLQAKTAWLLHAEGLDEPDDSLPPGFEAAYRNHPIVDKSQIPLIKWQHPRRFLLAEEWRVVAGEESQERSIENFRQQGVLEAIYPRPSSIPPNPLLSADVQATHTVDGNKYIPLVPITAIEDEDAAEHSNPPLPSMMSTAVAALGAIAALGAEPDLTAAAAVAYAAIAKSSEENSLIDRDLLVRLLRDPSMVNELLTQQTCAAPQPLSHRNIIRPPHVPNLPFASSSGRAAAAAPPPPPPQVKDVSYYKSLIQKHGKERQEGSVVVESANQREVKAKMQRPCSYFNTPRGCRNGAGCMFLHDASLNVDQQSGAGKRIKLDGGIAGRN